MLMSASFTDSVRNTSSKLTGKNGIGVPIGNYLSQYFANLYLSELDHLGKEELKCKFYYRCLLYTSPSPRDCS